MKRFLDVDWQKCPLLFCCCKILLPHCICRQLLKDVVVDVNEVRRRKQAERAG